MKDKIRIRIEGLNHERLLTRLSSEGIRLYDLKRERCALEMNVYRADMPIVIDLCNGLCYNVINKGPVGQYKYRRSIIENLFVIVGVGLVFAYCVLAGMRLSDVLVVDEANLTEKQAVVAILEEMGIKAGTFMNTVDVDEVENRLSQKISGCEYVIVHLKGSIMTVVVTARSEKPPQTDTQPRDIIALCDGIVTRVVAIKGTAEVNVGDSVKKGQVLISGRVEYADGTVEDVHAEGRVYAKVSQCAEVVFVEERIRFELTGRSITLTEFEIFGHRVGSIRKNPFEVYDTQSKRLIFAPAPVVMYKITYSERVRIVEKVTFEEVKNELIAKAKQLAEEKSGFDTEDFSVEVLENDLLTVRVTVFGTVIISD